MSDALVFLFNKDIIFLLFLIKEKEVYSMQKTETLRRATCIKGMMRCCMCRKDIRKSI